MLSGKFLLQHGKLGLRQFSTHKLTQQKGLKNAMTKAFQIPQRNARTHARANVRSWETAKAPTRLGAENIGRAVLGGACAAGVGALCFYGLGLSNDVGAIDKARFWPDEMRQRVKSTYLYFTGSLGITAVSAFYLSRSKAVFRMMNANRWLVFGGSLAAMIGSSIACQSIEYQPGFNAKHLAWTAHSGIVGVVIAPLMLVGGPLVLRAAAYTAGTVAALSLTAACAPDEKFLTWGGPLSLALGGICVASIGGMFLPATSAVAPAISSLVTYGGLVVFGGFMLYDTQKIIKHAELTTYSGKSYDPINASIGIYMDTINIFIRILMIMAGNNRRK
ncbi:growth hormone-inducible transmembrane protein-like [Hydractinia symbiolongicarpus]|uniref:growth hormone-inducible transmembrane protein-like n=1 Tax=Hydractinia symbiolongicarpus TaxID=13093 RepID=UPI00254BC059|nr:growth hormone-inducible transmembrane protein-like [Hydractinia symbiolongicarpus]